MDRKKELNDIINRLSVANLNEYYYASTRDMISQLIARLKIEAAMFQDPSRGKVDTPLVENPRGKPTPTTEPLVDNAAPHVEKPHVENSHVDNADVEKPLPLLDGEWKTDHIKYDPSLSANDVTVMGMGKAVYLFIPDQTKIYIEDILWRIEKLIKNY